MDIYNLLYATYLAHGAARALEVDEKGDGVDIAETAGSLAARLREQAESRDPAQGWRLAATIAIAGDGRSAAIEAAYRRLGWKEDEVSGALSHPHLYAETRIGEAPIFWDGERWTLRG